MQQSFVIADRIPLKHTFAYRDRTFHSESRGTSFRVYADKTGLAFVGEGDLDLRTPLPRWLIRPDGGRAKLLLSGANKQDAVYQVIDLWLEIQYVGSAHLSERVKAVAHASPV